MKVYISCDMEGLAGVSARDEVTKGHGDYPAACAQMAREVTAAMEGAFAAGAEEIWIKDAHWTGRNLEPAALPSRDDMRVRLIRGWSGHPYGMVQELDDSFGAAIFLGYHAAASRGGNPLAHTLSSRHIARLELNGRVASEFLIFSYAAALEQVPVVLLAGDEMICHEAREINETIETVATLRGQGPSVVSLSPAEVTSRIRQGVERALVTRRGQVLLLPNAFDLDITFREGAEAYRRSFYPGARLVDDTRVQFHSEDYFECLRLLQFMTL
jgi:D-amino peptidase